MVLFRDSNGKLLGGEVEVHRGRAACTAGAMADTVYLGAIPDAIDTSRTEVYPYCDPLPPGPRLPDGPVN
jgi:hypothetical protein